MNLTWIQRTILTDFVGYLLKIAVSNTPFTSKALIFEELIDGIIESRLDCLANVHMTIDKRHKHQNDSNIGYMRRKET